MAKKPKVVFLTPFLERPTKPFIAALEAAVPLLEEAGWDHGTAFEVGNAYISLARASLLRSALNAQADVMVYLDYDISFEPEDLLTLVEFEAPVVAGTYRFKTDEVEYMGHPELDHNGVPLGEVGNCIQMIAVPAGFLKITRSAVIKFMEAYPHLVYGEPCLPYIDLFNHGAVEKVWLGEDYSFSRRWREMGETLWCLPDLNITHHAGDKAFPGNYHDYLCSLPGGRLPSNKN